MKHKKFTESAIAKEADKLGVNRLAHKHELQRRAKEKNTEVCVHFGGKVRNN